MLRHIKLVRGKPCGGEVKEDHSRRPYEYQPEPDSEVELHWPQVCSRCGQEVLGDAEVEIEQPREDRTVPVWVRWKSYRDALWEDRGEMLDEKVKPNRTDVWACGLLAGLLTVVDYAELFLSQWEESTTTTSREQDGVVGRASALRS